MKRFFLLIATLVIAARPASGASCSTTTFIAAATYATPNPGFIVTADFNGDGLADVATTRGSSSISVLLNTGNGTFAAPLTTSATDNPYALAASDLRGNGTTDLVVVVYDGIEVLLGLGDGTFAAPVFYPAPNSYYSPLAVAIGKFDANGSPDVAVSAGYGQSIILFPGNGDGTFGAALNTAAPGVGALAAGDFNADGKLDLVSSNGNAGKITYFPGLGNGTFGPGSDFIAGYGIGDLVAGDFDGDGILDAAVDGDGFVSVLLGNGNGTFQAALQYATGLGRGAIAASDFDQNGSLDLAVSDSVSIATLPGNGDGSFGSAAPYLAGSGAGDLAVDDLDGDSFPDVVSVNASANSVSVLLNAGTGALLAIPETKPLTGPTSPYYTSPTPTRGDWNGDGREDLAWTANGRVVLVQSLGLGRFAQTGQLADDDNNPQLNAVGSGDFDGDAAIDLAASDNSNVYLFHGNGDGTFAAPQSAFNYNDLRALTVGDYNGDGRADVALMQGCCGSQTLIVLLGNGDGTFQPAVQTAIAIDATLLVPGDFNQDGKADLVAAASDGTVLLIVSNGDGTFQPPTVVIPSRGCCYSVWVATGAFGGGALDLLVSQGNPSVALYPGNGDGTFGAPVTVGLAASAGPVTAADYDGDGHQDFAALSGGSSILVFPGLGNRHFQTPTPYPTDTTLSLCSGNFSGSGAPGIAAIGPTGITALVNARLGATVRPVSVLVGSSAILTAVGAGFGPLDYQWRKSGIPLSDGGSVSGATTATLVIDPAEFTDAGSYDVVVTDSCTTATSNATTLSVEFADVPVSNIFYADIITIATAGVTAGCGGADYCPNSLVTRAQMAVFLLKSEHGSAYAPPACSGIFADVPCPSTYADWVQQLSNEGVTAGCGGGNYCPDASVTRAQMAVFLLKTSLGSGYVPPAPTAIFGDIPVDAFAAEWIDDLYNRGIAGGCSASPLLYCPNSPVNRGQMAAFLVNTFFGP